MYLYLLIESSSNLTRLQIRTYIHTHKTFHMFCFNSKIKPHTTPSTPSITHLVSTSNIVCVGGSGKKTLTISTYVDCLNFRVLRKDYFGRVYYVLSTSPTFVGRRVPTSTSNIGPIIHF